MTQQQKDKAERRSGRIIDQRIREKNGNYSVILTLQTTNPKSNAVEEIETWVNLTPNSLSISRPILDYLGVKPEDLPRLDPQSGEEFISLKGKPLNVYAKESGDRVFWNISLPQKADLKKFAAFIAENKDGFEPAPTPFDD